ncbi:hypothetical protein ES705_33762 [subsurface metagenome]
MKLKYNRTSELEVVGFGIFKPNQIIKIDDELEAKRYLSSGYFNEVKEKKKKVKVEKTLTWGTIKGKSKPFEDIPKEVKVKKSKKKGDDK